MKTTIIAIVALFTATYINAQGGITANHTNNHQWWISGGSGAHKTTAHLLLQNSTSSYWGLFNNQGNLSLGNGNNPGKMFKMNTDVGINGKAFINGNLYLENSGSKRSIYTWNRNDTNWRIGMNANPGFSRAIANSHVQYLTYWGGVGQGFAVGVNNGESSFEIEGSEHQAFFRGNVGIGVTNPTNNLEVAGSFKADRIFLGNKELILGDNDVISVNQFLTEQVWIPQADSDNINFNTGNVGIGTHNSQGWKLAVNGKIRAKEIKVETGWADFVFYKDYQLPTLEEVENHIKEKGHLKDIPSAIDVAKNGIYLGQMNSKLLQKIEELTLYTIAQEKKIQKLEKDNVSLNALNLKLAKIQDRITKLERQ